MKTYLVGSCVKCGGHCCKVITLPNPSLNHKYAKFPPYDFWAEVTIDSAAALNPWLISEVSWEKFRFFTCAHMQNGLCAIYKERPIECRDYPRYDAVFESYCEYPDCFHVPWCNFRIPVLDAIGQEYEILEDGESCRLKYLEMIATGEYSPRKCLGHNLLKLLASQIFMAGT